MVDSLSLVKFNVVNFHSVLINSRPFYPVSTIFFKLVSALIDSEPKPLKETKDRLKWIHKNTHEKVELPLSVVEYSVFKNIDKGLNKEITLGRKDFTLIDLYSYLDEVSLELTLMVIDIAKKYSLDIPLNSLAGSSKQNINLEQ